MYQFKFQSKSQKILMNDNEVTLWSTQRLETINGITEGKLLASV